MRTRSQTTTSRRRTSVSSTVDGDVVKEQEEERNDDVLHLRGGASAWSESSLLALLLSTLAACFLGLMATRGDGSSPPPLLFLREILAGGVAAIVGEVSLYPLEVVKVRLQTGAALFAKKGSMWSNGMVAGSSRALVYHGLRLGLFPAIKRAAGGPTSLLQSVLLGACCGALGAALCNPLDLAKTRLQRDPARYANSLEAVLTIARSKDESLWRGAPATVLRAAMGSAGQLATYDAAKRRGVGILLATVFSSAAYVTLAAPADVVKSRLMVDTAAGGGRKYRGGWHCAVTTVREEGPQALFKGWIASILRLLPITILVFPLLESLRITLGAGAF